MTIYNGNNELLKKLPVGSDRAALTRFRDYCNKLNISWEDAVIEDYKTWLLSKFDANETDRQMKSVSNRLSNLGFFTPAWNSQSATRHGRQSVKTIKEKNSN